MTIQRMDHVGIVVDDLAVAVAFFAELGLELETEARVEGRWVDRVVGLEGVRSDIAMMRTPDGHARLELCKFHTPPGRGGDPGAPAAGEPPRQREEGLRRTEPACSCSWWWAATVMPVS
jgi:catechol 2,3-dioxygenase-like lactoylglutathione lyase family enzyme